MSQEPHDLMHAIDMARPDDWEEFLWYASRGDRRKAAAVLLAKLPAPKIEKLKGADNEQACNEKQKRSEIYIPCQNAHQL